MAPITSVVLTSEPALLNLHHPKLKESGGRHQISPYVKGLYSLAKAIGPDRLTRGRFTGEGDVGEASRFAASVRTEQSETLRLHIEPLNCGTAPLTNQM